MTLRRTRKRGKLPPLPYGNRAYCWRHEALPRRTWNWTKWEDRTIEPSLEKSPERSADFTTVSGYPIHRLYSEADLSDWSAERDLGVPGEPPYTRGIHATMYRARLWTMRQFAGFGTAEDTNGASAICSRRDKRAFRGLRSADADGIRLRSSAVAKAKSANAAWRSVRWRTWKCCSTRFRWRTSPPR